MDLSLYLNGKNKTKVFFCFIFILNGIFGFSQKIDIHFELTYRPKVEDTLLITENHMLSIDVVKNSSLFYSTQNDTSFNYSIFKDFQKKKYVQIENISNVLYGGVYEFNKNDWKLESDKKETLGHTTYKSSIAFGGRKWIAWYAPDIPFMDGPYKFEGLPGLILEISSEDGDYSFIAQGIENSSGTIEFPNKAIIFPTKEREIAFKKEVLADPSAQYRKDLLNLKNKGLGVSVTFNGKEVSSRETEANINARFYEWLKNHNNPIENGEIWIK